MAVFFLRGCDLALACLPRLGPAEGGGVVPGLESGLSLSGSKVWSDNSEEVEMIIGDPRCLGMFRSASRRADEEDRPAKEAVSSLDVRLAGVLNLSLSERPFILPLFLPGALAEVAAFD